MKEFQEQSRQGPQEARSSPPCRANCRKPTTRRNTKAFRRERKCWVGSKTMPSSARHAGSGEEVASPAGSHLFLRRTGRAGRRRRHDRNSHRGVSMWTTPRSWAKRCSTSVACIDGRIEVGQQAGLSVKGDRAGTRCATTRRRICSTGPCGRCSRVTSIRKARSSMPIKPVSISARLSR